MFNELKLAKNTEKVKTRIETAGKGDTLSVSFAGSLNLLFKDRKTPCLMGNKNKALFSESLTDSLSSV